MGVEKVIPTSNEQLKAMDWTWVTRLYYAATVEFPKRPGDLAIEVCHKSIASLQMELRVATERRDIGKIVTERL